MQQTALSKAKKIEKGNKGLFSLPSLHICGLLFVEE